MATKTSLLGLTKPAYTEAADIAVLNTNFDLIDKAVGNGARSANILVNSDFHPDRFIARAGLNGSHGSMLYIGDNWRRASGCIATSQSDGLHVASGDQFSFVEQRVKLRIGNTYTMALCTTSRSSICRIAVFNYGLNVIYAQEANANDILCLTFTAKETDIALLFYPGYVEGGGSAVFKWAALYEGTYTADTLPAYVVPDKRIEMIRCDVPLNPPNLLENSWFVNPINQRGIASGGTVKGWSYFIDRWCNYGDKSGTVSFSNNGMIYNFPMYQHLNPDTVKAGKVMTAAVKWADGTIQVATGTITRGSSWTWFHSGDNNGRLVGVIDDGNGSNSIRIDNDNGDTIVWAALYEGAYDVDTLPEYHCKGYAAELAECQRYYIKIATQPVSGWCYNWGRVTVFVPLPVTMRVASPTVSVTSASRNFYIGSTAYAAEPTGSTAVSNGISVYFSHSHTGNGQCVMPEFSAEVSADL